MEKKMIFIVNPIAGRGAGTLALPRLNARHMKTPWFVKSSRQNMQVMPLIRQRCSDK